MKNLFREMDLYKGIILACVVLIPVALGWSYHLNNRIDEGRRALRNAKKARGDLEEIGKYIKLIETQSKAKVGTSAQAMQQFFEKWIVFSDSGGTLKRTNFEIRPRPPRQLRRPVCEETEVEIQFKDGTKQLPLTRDFLNAVLYNCESRANWKVRELHIRNEDLKKMITRGDAPPRETSDSWEVQKLVFARRLPVDRSRSRTTRGR